MSIRFIKYKVSFKKNITVFAYCKFDKQYPFFSYAPFDIFSLI